MGREASKAADLEEDDTVAFRERTRTWDYVVRSGVAGGFAGCVVSINFLHLSGKPLTPSLYFIGENNNSTARPSENPFPNEEPPVRKVHRLMGWSRLSNEGNLCP